MSQVAEGVATKSSSEVRVCSPHGAAKVTACEQLPTKWGVATSGI